MKNMNNAKAKLMDCISEQGVNTLENVSFSQIKQWLETTDNETKLVIEELFEERIIEKKYKYYCDCGERIIVAHHSLLRDAGNICDNCERQKSASDSISESEVIYKIYGDYLKECVESEMIETYSINEGKEMIDKDEIKVFLGSSTEAKGFMEKVALWLEEIDDRKVKPIVWSDSSVFLPGRNTIDSLIDLTENVDAAVFIFNADDKKWNDTTLVFAGGNDIVRDNVLFEYGLFLGALDKNKVCFVCKNHPDLASDLNGITYIDGDNGDFRIKADLKAWIDSFE